MGALFSGSCYGSAADAGAAYFASVGPAITGADSFSAFEYRNSAWELVNYSAGVEVSASVASAPGFASCTLGESAADGITLGFLVLGVWAIAYWGRSLRDAGKI